MILEDDRGNKLDYFDRFPKNTNIGISLSGGTDSALLLFFFIKMVLERRDMDVKIYPIHGYDESRFKQKQTNHESWRTALKIEDWMRRHFYARPGIENILQPVNIFAYNKTQPSKREYHQPHFNYVCKRYDIPNHIVYGFTQGMPDELRPHQELVSDEQFFEYAQHPTKWINFPWGTVDKKFIAYQYKKYDIMDLSNLTGSCISDDTTPCKTCFWCRERFWAFKSYDGGVQ